MDSENVDKNKDSVNLSKKNEKAPMTDEERRKLAEKLDKELDEFIGGLEKRAYTEGWPEDRWEEEMEKHPFFMTKAPEDGEQLSPLMEGLQQLKYSETDNTPEELALTYKEDGNYNFKMKNYRLAIVSYTEGLRQKCEDSHLVSESCLADCRAALKLRPDYAKCRVRAVQCCLSLHRYDDCIALCDEILASCPTDKVALEMRAKAVAEKKSEERNARKRALIKKKEDERDQKLIKIITERGIRVEGNELSMDALEPCSPMAAQSKVHLDENDCLVWPVMFLYPEYQISELVQEFQCQLKEMFSNPPEWDKESSYVPDKLNIYYEDKSNNKLNLISATDTLRSALSRKSYVVVGGTPCFFIVVRESRFEQHFLSRHS
ncbi:Tetratricopeptide repeat protein 4 [Blattella germanica]|nr:Tetratricopeptide repeat protein 4 [Blattella germanica]